MKMRETLCWIPIKERTTFKKGKDQGCRQKRCVWGFTVLGEFVWNLDIFFSQF